jgi:glycosyltransferase involved in cell wall biosynthesis
MFAKGYQLRIALLTRSYPADDDLYKYPFVHRRVRAYLAAGHAVRVFRLGPLQATHVFDGVACNTITEAAFVTAVAEFEPHVVAIHGLDEVHWSAAHALGGKWPILAWLHGSEIPAFQRVKAMLVVDSTERAHTLRLAENRAAFWRGALDPWPEELRLVFPSHSAADLMRDDVGSRLVTEKIVILPNPIDTDLFSATEKQPDAALRILSIRPHDSWCYGNDLAVEAVLRLRSHARFNEMHFTFIGNGPLFNETFAPLRDLPNVTLLRRFFRQEEIAAEHARHGIFLVPSRLDTQGVSRDEAMASGLVPVTNRVFAVSEFVDERCAGLADAEDVAGLAAEIARMIDDPTLYVTRSRAAIARVRAQSAHTLVIPRELAWMWEAAHAAA